MKISIIIATYNSRKTIRNTIESVLRQSYTNYELIAIDGASVDGTQDLVNEYSPVLKEKLLFVSEPDGGIYDAMNKGLRMAKGDIVGILNSDDFYTSDDILETVADVFKNSDVDAVYGDVHYVNGNNIKKRVRYYSSALFRPWMMRFGMMPAHPSFYCRRSVYEEYGLFDSSYKVAADFELLLRLIYKGRLRMQYIHKDFVTMRTGGASSSWLTSWKPIMKEHLRALKAHGIYSNFLMLSLRYIYKVYELIRR